MKVLVIGSGGREHALTHFISRDPVVTEVHAAPGNPGMELNADIHPLDDITDADAIIARAKEFAIDLVVIGPEAPLVAGVADRVREAGFACFGPSEAASQLEGSKAFAKDVMAAAGVPTAESRTCRTLDEVEAAMEEFGAPYVIKEDGLANGKGVLVTKDKSAALEHAKGRETVVVEEFLDGPEVSLFVVTDGTRAVAFPPAQDYKRVGDGDTGPNTGGMGAYTPLPWAPDDLVETVTDTIVTPTLEEMKKRDAEFQGLLYVGLALTAKGPKVIEFNARFGDPETQAVLTLNATPLAQLLHAAANGDISEYQELEQYPGAAVAVVMAANGYPEEPTTGSRIAENQFSSGSVKIFHCGTARDEEERLISASGRVMCAVGRGGSLKFSRNMVYATLRSFWLTDLFWRHDIAENAVLGQVEVPRS